MWLTCGSSQCVWGEIALDFGHRLAVTYKDLRSIPEFIDKTILAVKAPQDTILNCDVQEVSGL